MITVLHGDEEFSIHQEVERLRQEVMADPGVGDLNVVVLEKPVDVSRLQGEADVLPFLGDRRLVLVREWLSDLPKQETALRALLDYLPHVPDSTHLVFVETKPLPKNHPVLRALAPLADQGKAQVKAFLLPPPRERRAYVQKWIREHARRLQVDLDPAAVTLLADILGTNFRLLHQELEKLRTYAGAGGYITEEDVRALVPYTQEANIFHLVTAIGEGQKTRAIRLLQQALREGQHPLQILALLARQYRIYIGMKELDEAGKSSDEIARALRVPAWTLRRDLKVARRLKWHVLHRAMEWLLQTDVSIKQGEIDPNLALQLLVTHLTLRSSRRGS
ncbi:MAG: DNA polymerase III subunit delta [Chloroflexi bacterium]|nr:DNA polymerase III subunit delta [Chloroflexota bacterium]